MATGSWSVIAAQNTMLTPMRPTRPFITFSKPPYPPRRTKAHPTRLWSTAPHGCEIRPPVRLAMPRPVAFVRAALTATVHSTR